MSLKFHKWFLSNMVAPQWMAACRLPTKPVSIISTFMGTSVNPVHNAQVCYFNNVWLMFLIF